MRAAKFPTHLHGLISFPNSSAACARGQRSSSTRTVIPALLSAGACVTLAACASSAPYNPDHLSADRISQLGEVCQTVMGFQPSEALTENLWPDNPDSSVSTNSYRGCIATLSDSLQQVAAVQASRQAERECHLKGFDTGSSDLALCALTAEQTPISTTPIRLASLTDTPFLTSNKPTFSAQVPNTVHKEQVACAELGLDPNEEAFAGCVRGLRSVVSTSVINDAYRN